MRQTLLLASTACQVSIGCRNVGTFRSSNQISSKEKQWLNKLIRFFISVSLAGLQFQVGC
jgi:hypothetical protein